MKWLSRPMVLVLGIALLAVSTLVLLWGPLGNGTATNQALPRPVPDGDQEIVWLNAATSTVTWERFVSAVHRVQTTCPELALQVDDRNAFPPQTTAVPELVLSVQGKAGRIWVRWYKFTGHVKINDWVEALAQRPRPPLAIIGGGSSDRARDLAQILSTVSQRPGVGPQPLLFITTATSDEVPDPKDPTRFVELNSIYPERTYRFCFTNRQMAEAVSGFIWKQNELRPDPDPVYVVAYEDDPYSEDLAKSFQEVLWCRSQARSVTDIWAWPAAGAGVGAVPPALLLNPVSTSFWRLQVGNSIGTYNKPNAEETRAADHLMERGIGQHPGQQRRLLILPAAVQPTRRFLRALMRIDPGQAHRLTVATGDSIDFNSIYRDRNLAWPIQDLPFALVFFCHRNPVADIEPDVGSSSRPTNGDRVPSGSEDVLLFADIAATMVRAAYTPTGLVDSPDKLGESLRADRPERFDADGNQAGSTGEYVVWLQPIRDGDRIAPQALLRVYRSQENQWVLVRSLTLDYR